MKEKKKSLNISKHMTWAQKNAKNSTFSCVQNAKYWAADSFSQFLETTYLSYLPVRPPCLVRCNIHPEFALCKFPPDHQEWTNINHKQINLYCSRTFLCTPQVNAQTEQHMEIAGCILKKMLSKSEMFLFLCYLCCDY